LEKAKYKDRISLLFKIESLNRKGKMKLSGREELFYRLRIIPLITFIMLCSFFILSGQVVVDNTEKPKNKAAGRIIQLEEVMRIRDDGKNFVIRNPQQISELEDGSIIFFDYPYVIKVDKEGKFLFKIPGQGQGPRESHHPNSYFIEGNRIRIYSWIPPKVLEYDLRGKFIKEFKTPLHGPFAFIGIVDDRIYGVRDEIRFSEAIHQEGIIQTPYRLYEISFDFKELRKVHDIMMEHYVKKARWVRRAMFTAVAYKHFLFYVHSAEYSIERFNLRTERTELIFSRKYIAPRSDEAQDYQDPYERFDPGFRPPPQHEFYIQRLQIFRNHLWVKTSTEKDGGQKWQIDVFDLDGNYVDSFYLAFPGGNQNHWSQFTITNDSFIFVAEEEKETGLLSIGKYILKNY